MCKRRLNVLIGAGFSKPAGLPLSQEINAHFTADVRGKLLKLTSGEWKWDYTQGTDLVDGGKNVPDHMPYSYILSELVSAFSSETGGFESYEKFYQWVLDVLDVPGKIDIILDIVRNKLEADYPKAIYASYHSALYRGWISDEIISMIDGLISDLLIINISDAELVELYSPFLDFIRQFDQVNIFSLNHDMLLERLFALFGMYLYDGFTDFKSPLVSKLGSVEQPVFKGFEDPHRFNLVKLHGGGNIHIYRVCNQYGSLLDDTGVRIYFKPTDHWSKFFLDRIDHTGKVLQSTHPPPKEMFLTGVNKDDLIKSNSYFRKIFTYFKRKIKMTELLIIGYSFNDSHINRLIRKVFCVLNFKRVININPNDRIPYRFKLRVISLMEISELDRYFK